MQKTTVLNVNPNKVERWFIAGDWHSFDIHEPSLNVMIKMAKQDSYVNRRLIINGDFIDAVYGMKNNEGFKFWKSKARNAEEFFLPRWEEEAEWANNMLDRLQEVFSQIIYIGGNHDQPRLDNIIKVVSSGYEHAFDIIRTLKLEKRQIPFVPYNHWLDFGSLSITHGMAHGATACKKHYEFSGARNVIFSHVHKYECKPFHHRGETIQVSSLPAMCGLNPEYMRNTDNNWSNGFGEILMKPNGNFNLNVHQLFDNEVVLSNGTILNGEAD